MQKKPEEPLKSIMTSEYPETAAVASSNASGAGAYGSSGRPSTSGGSAYSSGSSKPAADPEVVTRPSSSSAYSTTDNSNPFA